MEGPCDLSLSEWESETRSKFTTHAKFTHALNATSLGATSLPFVAHDSSRSKKQTSTSTSSSATPSPAPPAARADSPAPSAPEAAAPSPPAAGMGSSSRTPSPSSSHGKKRSSTSSSATPSPAPLAARADSPAPSAPEAAAPSPPAAGVTSSSSRTPSSVRALRYLQKCAACKYRHSRCSAGCPLAPYFPGDKPEMFEKVRRLFGVKNLLYLMDKVEPVHHDRFMRSIKYEAETQAACPVHGALRVTRNLEARLRDIIIERTTLELRVLEAQQQQQQPRNMAVVPHAAHATQLGVTHQRAGAEVSTEQGMALGSNSGAALGAVHQGSDQLGFQQQQPQPLPPSPRPPWMALWDQQQQPSPPPSP